MEMEEKMEVEFMVFEAREIDLDYEFDAPKYFDFTSRESIAEAREVQRWFDMAPSCPPSPFVAKFLYSLLENVNTSPKSKDDENRVTLLNDDMGPEVSAIEVDDTGLTFYHQKSTDKSNPKVKSTVKPTFPRSSTLMKPTASQLAKQNHPTQIGVSRFQILLGQKERSLCNSSALESHSAKRQKLEGGHVCKIGDGKQQTDFIHKTSKKDGFVDKISSQAKLRLTVPREPDLVTAHRAQRMRPKEQQYMTAPARRFKARPLNRKILEAPFPLPKKSAPKLPEFQEFHLKTLERAMQHHSSVSSSSFQCNDSNKGLDKPSTISEIVKTESRRPTTMNPPKQDGCGATHTFKARPLNKKIFSSKGEMGVFQTSIRETTVPMEFNFHTEKRFQHNPPIDLFSKLSLTSELQPNNKSQLQFPQPSYLSTKGPKENRLNPFQTEQKMVHSVKERQSIFVGKQQIQYGSNMGTNEVRNQSIRRSLGIR
ncbi:PREDICTED: protein TPX2-like [Populus euphratica]|uniref:Protein TPX2-like n=1 Tax=Populus euphratica TaxID=75702 RepID=A0AAJ6UH29_POPEU|nr:PREDICTED: protein TPX2-like [Populus euphratica]